MPKIIKSILALFVKMTFLLPCALHAQKTDSTVIIKKSNIIIPLTLSPLPVLSRNFYATHLPVFCKTELKIEKATKIPIKFRLGSLADCNKLEGKH